MDIIRGGFMMKYLLCYTIEEDGIIKVESETYTDYADAVKSYTLLCGSYNHVVFANLDVQGIIRQYAYERECTSKGVMCIL